MAAEDKSTVGEFFGRQRELKGLHRWLRHSWGSSIAVLGQHGVGKTTLIRKLETEANEHSRPFIWFDATKFRSVEDLFDALRPKLGEVRQYKYVTAVIDNVEAFAGGSEREAERLRDKFHFDRFEYRRNIQEDFHGRLGWILVGRRLPWRIRHPLREERKFPSGDDVWEMLDEPPLFRGREDLPSVTLHDLRESEIEEWLDRLALDGLQMPFRVRAGLATLIQSRLGGNPLTVRLLIEQIRQTGDPLAALTALGARSNLSISLEGDVLKVAAAAELNSAQIEIPNGLVTFFPHLYLPRLAQKWREAIGEFEVLINRPKLRESELQKFFEAHPHFLRGLDYSRLVAQPVLERMDGQGKLIPDFFLQPSDNEFADILDLKLPSCPLIVGTKDRLRFSAAVSEALAQVREYRDYFEDSSNRNKIKDRYGLTAYRPTVSVVIGMNKFGLSAEKQKQIFDGLPKEAKVVTYDQLLAKMKRQVELHA